jgi:hypothetical protein
VKDLRGFFNVVPKTGAEKPIGQISIQQTQHLAATSIRKTKGATDMTYNAGMCPAQGQDAPYLDAVNILFDDALDAEYIGPRTAPDEQAETFFNRLPEEDRAHLKWSVITCWEGTDWQPKIFTADEAIYWLQIYGILSAEQRVSSPENFMRLYADRERIKAAGLASRAFQPVGEPV